MPSTQEVLDHQMVVSHLQPLVSVKKRAVIGLEALARCNQRGPNIPDATEMFAQAQDARLNDQLDDLCLKQALQAFNSVPQRPQDLVLFLNLDATRLVRGLLSAQSVSKAVELAGLNPRDVVLEFSDRVAEAAPGLRALVETLQGFGFSVALDDVDGSPGSLQRLVQLKPDLVKADTALVRSLGQSSVQQEILGALCALSRRQGALIVAEGVETEDDAAYCLEMGADLLQGFHYGRPAESDRVSLSLAQASAQRSAERLKANLTSRRRTRQREDERHLQLLDRIRAALEASESAGLGRVLEGFVNAVASLECLYVLDAKGQQVTPTVVWRHQRESQRSRLFAPAREGADHSLKDYYLGLTLQEQDQYLSEPYVSLATGNLCRTLTVRFKPLSGQGHVLCMDIRSA
jgi:EAL domain-containing protein (putative c-di-GMP-specific phosphodiesterase class I)